MAIILQRILAGLTLCIVSPLLIIISLIIRVTSGRPIFYKQKRMGKGGKSFWMWKFRTMGIDAEKQQRKYSKLNEADGPVFKIKNDPRFTKFGKWLSRSGLDELPQLINVMRGEMALVGPRPLPVNEGKKIPAKYKRRFEVLPGMTSSWVVEGAHKLTFVRWMELDVDYVDKRSTRLDCVMLGKTSLMMLKFIGGMITSALGVALGKYEAVIAIVIVAMGVLSRYWRMLTELVWNDEIFYLTIARENSLIDLLQTNHWIVDHPPLYLVFMHYWSMVSTNPIWIRWPNLIFYLISAYTLYKLGDRLFRSTGFKLLLSGLYALYPYFVGIEWQAIPYAMTFSIFMISLYCFSYVLEEDSDDKYVIYSAVFMALFFYTSFEAGYYAVSLFLICALIFPKMARIVRWRVVKMFSIAFVLVAPELVVTVGKMKEFAGLSTHWLEWKWGLDNLMVDVFGLAISPTMFGLLIFLTLALLRLFWSERKMSLLGIIVPGLIIGFFGAVATVSSIFFYASHPKGYYYVILLIWITILLLVQSVLVKFSESKWLVYCLLLGCSVVLFNPGKGWYKAQYLYSTPQGSPFVIRESILSTLEQDSTWVIVTDEEMGEANWRDSIHFGWYYFKCLDIPTNSRCQLGVEARKDIPNKIGSENVNLIGVIIDSRARDRFERVLCTAKEKCLIWDFEKNALRQVN